MEKVHTGDADDTRTGGVQTTLRRKSTQVRACRADCTANQHGESANDKEQLYSTRVGVKFSPVAEVVRLRAERWPASEFSRIRLHLIAAAEGIVARLFALYLTRS